MITRNFLKMNLSNFFPGAALLEKLTGFAMYIIFVFFNFQQPCQRLQHPRVNRRATRRRRLPRCPTVQPRHRRHRRCRHSCTGQVRTRFTTYCRVLYRGWSQRLPINRRPSHRLLWTITVIIIITIISSTTRRVCIIIITIIIIWARDIKRPIRRTCRSSQQPAAEMDFTQLATSSR